MIDNVLFICDDPHNKIVFVINASKAKTISSSKFFVKGVKSVGRNLYCFYWKNR